MRLQMKKINPLINLGLIQFVTGENISVRKPTNSIKIVRQAYTSVLNHNANKLTRLLQLTPVDTMQDAKAAKDAFDNLMHQGCLQFCFCMVLLANFLSCARGNVLASAEETRLFKSSGVQSVDGRIHAEFMPKGCRNKTKHLCRHTSVYARCFLSSTLFFPPLFRFVKSSSSQTQMVCEETGASCDSLLPQ